VRIWIAYEGGVKSMMPPAENNDSIYAKIRKYLRTDEISGSNENQIIEKTAHALGLSFQETIFAFSVLKNHQQIILEKVAPSKSQQEVVEAIIHYLVKYEEEPENATNVEKKTNQNQNIDAINEEKLESNPKRIPYPKIHDYHYTDSSSESTLQKRRAGLAETDSVEDEMKILNLLNRGSLNGKDEKNIIEIVSMRLNMSISKVEQVFEFLEKHGLILLTRNNQNHFQKQEASRATVFLINKLTKNSRSYIMTYKFRDQPAKILDGEELAEKLNKRSKIASSFKGSGPVIGEAINQFRMTAADPPRYRGAFQEKD
jgi:hypothetical protein